MRARGDDGPAAGDLLAGRYRIEAPLGHGAMGAVYRATRLVDGTAVAIKLMHARLTRDESVARRFDREVAVATRLDHINCVRVLEGGTTEDGTKFLVMPLLQGVELRQRLTGPMPAPWVVDIIAQVLRGLDHAHRLGFVHRDVKPENVFVVRDRGSDVAQLLDFGLVKLLDPVPGGVQLTREGLVFGTPAYMSPEQAAGQRIDARADLYGVGVMMYEMLAGAPPFQADEAVVLLRRQMLADPPALPAHVPAPLAAFVMRLLEKNPRDRFASATEALAALADAARGRVSTREVAAAPIATPSPAELSWHAATRSESAWEAPSASLIRTTATEQRAFAIVALLLAVLAGGLWAVLGAEPQEADDTGPSTAAGLASMTTTGGEAPQTDATSSSDVTPPAATPASAEPTPATPEPTPAKAEPAKAEPAKAEPAKAEPAPAPTKVDPQPRAKPRTIPKSKPKATSTPRTRAPRTTPTPEPEPEKPRVLRTDRPPRTPSKASKLPDTSIERRIPARRLVPRTS